MCLEGRGDQLQISTTDAKPKEWPDAFSKDVEATLERLRKNYNEALTHLDNRSDIFEMPRSRQKERTRARA
jgi:hypothetical protein